MRADLSPDERASRIRELGARLMETEAELQALTAGEIDAILSPDGAAPLLLRPAQEALREAETRSRELIAALPIIACELTADGSVVFVNDAVSEILGFEAEDLVGRSWWETVSDGGPPAPSRGDELSGEEHTVRARDGSLRSIVWTSVHRSDAREGGERVLLFGVDMTARREAEAAERRLLVEQAARAEAVAAERRTALLAEASRLLAASLRYDATLTSIARLAVTEIAEYCIVDVVEPDGSIRRVDVAHAHPDGSDALREQLADRPEGASLPRSIEEVVATGASRAIPWVDEETATALVGDAGGETLIGRSMISAPLTARGSTLGAITLLSHEGRRAYGSADLSLVEELARRAALAVDNARLYEAALTASQAKTDFLAVMSHELRTPLNAILGYADLLRMGVPAEIPDPSQEYVARVQVAARHLLQMIEEILTLSRVEAGQEDVHREEVELCGFVEETASLIEPLARAKQLDFRCHCPPPPVLVQMDARKARQILLNLLSNGVKFTQEGGLSLSAEIEDSNVLFVVQDSGIGIAPENRERIFDPFWQVEQGHSRSSDGAGLGLSVTRRLARLMGGDVVVHDGEAGGSRFEVRIPSS